jgi:hypothetical protein
MPPSTKAAADVKPSILAVSSVTDAIATVSQPWNKTGKKKKLRHSNLIAPQPNIESLSWEERQICSAIYRYLKSGSFEIFKLSDILLLNAPYETLIAHLHYKGNTIPGKISIQNTSIENNKICFAR